MLNFFSQKKDLECPISLEMRRWMENAFLWLCGQFTEELVISQKVLCPTKDDFSVRYDGSIESLNATASIVATQMQLNPEEINLSVYKENIHEVSGDFGFRMFTQIDETGRKKLAAGLYFGKGEEGKYDVLIEEGNLKHPETLVAVLAHEFAHIKILGEKRLDFNDESLTDLVPLIFGLGIFNANACFNHYTTFDSWGHQSIGYLKQQEWGYALALFAFYRREKTPEWIKRLTPNIKSDFLKSERYIYQNIDKIFMEEYHPQEFNHG